MNSETTAYLKQALESMKAERDRLDQSITSVRTALEQLGAYPTPVPPETKPRARAWTPEKRAEHAAKLRAYHARRKKAAAKKGK